jgi:hypothetical protein
MKVVQFVEEHNFHVDWHFQFWVEKGEKLGRLSASPVSRNKWHSKFGNNLCKIRREKHPRAFVKVVEGSEIYNFRIHHLVHFSCKNSSFYHSNSASPKKIRQAAMPPALQRAGAPARAVRRLGVWAARAFPRPCRPEAGRVLRGP